MHTTKRGDTPLARTIEKLWKDDQVKSGEEYDLTALARRSKMNQPTLLRIFSGQSRDPKTKTIIPLADYFGVSVPELRGEQPTKRAQSSAKARLLAQKIDNLPPKAQQCIVDLVDILLSQAQRKTG